MEEFIKNLPKALSLSKDTLCDFAQNSFSYSFLEEKDKMPYIEKIDEYCKNGA